MASLTEMPHDLTKNQALVFGALSQSEAPLSAYSILDQLRGEGFRAPLQVYRALEKLRGLGLVHRLECLNAFVACRHPSCGSHHTTAFAICEECGLVSEFLDEAISDQFKAWVGESAFEVKKSIVELRGVCRECKAA